MKLSNLNNYYSKKIKTDELSQLKLADVITLKNTLREKIHREIQGLRTSPSQFQELNKINPNDLEIIMKNIKLSLEQ